MFFEKFSALDIKIQVTIISAIVGIITALITIGIKDFLIPNIFRKKIEKKNKLDILKKYSNPIFSISVSLAFRLKEIFNGRNSFLLGEGDYQDEFFKYRYQSTVYRFCALLGWIQASKKELTFFDAPSGKKSKKIEVAILNFQKSLADGKHIEELIVNGIFLKWKVKHKKSIAKNKSLLGLKIEQIAKSFLSQGQRLSDIKEINSSDKVILVEKVKTLVETETNQSINEELKVNEILSIIGIKQYWIYFDWQSAIGDYMLNNSENTNRKYEIIGYGEFEEKLQQNNVWLDRSARLFQNLDFNKKEFEDARITQLKNMTIAIIELIEILASINNNKEVTFKKSLNELKIFSKELKRTYK